MNKAQLVDRITKQTHQTRQSVEEALNSAFDVIKKTVKKGDDVTLVGFGTFTQTKRRARLGRNPKTGVEIKIPAMTMPRFKPGKEFRKLIQ